MKTPKIERDMLADLARSGITPEQADQMGVESMDRDEVMEFMGNKEPFRFNGYLIPYHAWNGAKTGYSRIRRTGEAPRSFGQKKKPPKYIQKADTLPQLYIPKGMPKHKSPKTGLIKFPGNRLVITEGEKKAVAASARGIPCVALGGVYGFMSKKRGIRLLEEFDSIDYSDLIIDICYDSDVSVKNPVRVALERLSFILETEKRPKQINRVQLPSLPDVKVTGLDDYLMKHTVDDFLALPRVTSGSTDGISAISKEVVFVKKDGMFYNINHDRWYRSKYSLTSEFEGEHLITNPNDPLGPKISAIELWPALRNREATTVDCLTYTPGQDVRLPGAINLWRPSTIKPKRGTPKLWLRLLDHLTSNAPHCRDFLLQWLAYPIQHPGAKLLSSVFMWSKYEGTGKNFLVEPFFWDIYGKDNMAKITVDSLESQFNTFAARKQFIVTDEIYIKNSQARNATMGKLKTLITSPRVTINAKFAPPQEFTNHGNYYLTSNHEDALAISSNDRRFLVIEAPDKLEPEFYVKLDKWAKEEDGASVLYNYLLEEVDCSAFDPNADAPLTQAKRNAVVMSADPVDYYVRMLITEPEKLVAVNGIMPDRQLYTAEELVKLVNTYALDNKLQTLRISPDSMGRHLTGKIPRLRYHFLTAAKSTYYALLNRNHWVGQHKEDWRAHVRANVPVPHTPTVDGSDQPAAESKVVKFRRRRA